MENSGDAGCGSRAVKEYMLSTSPTIPQYLCIISEGQVAKRLSQSAVSTLSVWEAMSENQH